MRVRYHGGGELPKNFLSYAAFLWLVFFNQVVTLQQFINGVGFPEFRVVIFMFIFVISRFTGNLIFFDRVNQFTHLQCLWWTGKSTRCCKMLAK